MKDWSKWGWDFWQSIARHVGTAGITWLGTNVATGATGWHTLETLPIALVLGGVLPTVFTFLQSNPVPPDTNNEDPKS